MANKSFARMCVCVCACVDVEICCYILCSHLRVTQKLVDCPSRQDRQMILVSSQDTHMRARARSYTHVCMHTQQRHRQAEGGGDWSWPYCNKILCVLKILSIICSVNH